MRVLPKIDLNVTNRCNLRCSHCCFNSGEREMGELSFKEIKNILRGFNNIGGQRIDITGGEPLMREDIDRIVRMAKYFNLKTELVTNGILITRDNIQKYKEKFRLDGIAISLDGSKAEIYNRIRGADQKLFKKVIKTIKESAKAGLYTKVNTVVFKSNLEDLVNISELAIDCGAHEHGFYYFSPIGRGAREQSNVADPLIWLEIIRGQLIKLKDRIKFSVEVPLIETEIADRLNIKCFLEDPWHLQILPNGDVYPCAIMASYEKSLANLHSRTLKEVWDCESLWDRSYYTEKVLPLFEKFGGCVYYPSFSRLIKRGDYRFVCLCRKFDLAELQK